MSEFKESLTEARTMFRELKSGKFKGLAEDVLVSYKKFRKSGSDPRSAMFWALLDWDL